MLLKPRCDFPGLLKNGRGMLKPCFDMQMIMLTRHCDIKKLLDFLCDKSWTILGSGFTQIYKQFLRWRLDKKGIKRLFCVITEILYNL